MEQRLNVSLGQLRLDNPIIPASGTFGFGYEFADYYDINILGSISLKGTTREARLGNPTPRIAECPMGLLNSVGLQNPGVHEVIREELPRLREVYHKPVIANVSGFSLEEYAYTAKLLAEDPMVGIIELNISCPNVKHGGQAFGTSPESAREVVSAVKEVVEKPLYVKLSPNVADIVGMARSVEEAGADGLTLINTLMGMRIDLKKKRPILARKSGGFSGPAIFPIALRMVYEVYEAVQIPIMGCGGVMTARDVVEMMMAGATAVQVGSANLLHPTASRDLILDLPRVLDSLSIDKLEDIIGIAHQ